MSKQPTIVADCTDGPEKTEVSPQIDAADVRNVLLLSFCGKDAKLDPSCCGHDLRVISVQSHDGVEVTLAVRIRHYEGRDQCLTVYCHFNKHEDPLTTVSDVLGTKDRVGHLCEKWIEKNCLPERFWDALRSQRDPGQRLIVSGVGYGGLLASVVVEKILENDFWMCNSDPRVACVMVSCPIGMMTSEIANDAHFFHIAHEHDPICQLIDVSNNIGKDRSLFVKWTQGNKPTGLLARFERTFTPSKAKERSTSIGNIWWGRRVGGGDAKFEIQKYHPVDEAAAAHQIMGSLLESYHNDNISPFGPEFGSMRRKLYNEFIEQLDRELPVPTKVKRGYLAQKSGTPTVCLKPALRIFREESMEPDKLAFSVEVNSPFELFFKNAKVSLFWKSKHDSAVIPASKVDDGHEIDKGRIYLLKTVSSKKLHDSGCIPGGLVEAELKGIRSNIYVKLDWKQVSVRRKRLSKSSMLTLLEGTLLRCCNSGKLLDNKDWNTICEMDELSLLRSGEKPSNESMVSHIFAALVSTLPLDEDVQCGTGQNTPLTKKEAMEKVDEFVSSWRGPARTMVQCWLATRISEVIVEDIAAIIDGGTEHEDALTVIKRSLMNLELPSSHPKLLAALDSIQEGWSTKHEELHTLLMNPRTVPAENFEKGIGWGVESSPMPPLYLQQLLCFLSELRDKCSTGAVSTGPGAVKTCMDQALEFYRTVKGKYPTFPIGDITELWERSKKFVTEDKLFRVARPRFWFIVFRMVKCSISETVTGNVRKLINKLKNLSKTTICISLVLLVAAAATPVDEIVIALIIVRALLAATSLTNIIVQLSRLESRSRESLGSLLFIHNSVISSPSCFDHYIRLLMDQVGVTSSSIVAHASAAEGYAKITELAWKECDARTHRPELNEKSQKSVCQQLAYHYLLSDLRHSLEDMRGLGIIGRPGSGKSTVAKVIKDPGLLPEATPRTSRVIFDSVTVQKGRNKPVVWETIDFTGAFDADKRLSNIADTSAILLLRDTHVVIVATSADAVRRATSDSNDDSFSFRSHIQSIPVDAVKIFYIKAITSRVLRQFRKTRKTDSDKDIVRKSEEFLRTEIYTQLKELYSVPIDPMYIDKNGRAQRLLETSQGCPGNSTGDAVSRTDTSQKVENGKCYLMFSDFLPESVREETSDLHDRFHKVLTSNSSMVLGPDEVHKAMHVILGNIEI